MREDYSDVRRWLRTYKLLKKTIALKENHLNDFITEIYNPMKITINKLSRDKSGMQESAMSILERMSSIYLGMINDLTADIERMKKSSDEIFEAISRLDDYERSVCFCRYISGMSWNATAEKLGYETRQCQRFEERALKKLRENGYPKDKAI